MSNAQMSYLVASKEILAGMEGWQMFKGVLSVPIVMLSLSIAVFGLEGIPQLNPFEGMVPESARIYVISGNIGLKSNRIIDNSGHAAATVSLNVNSPGSPVILILTAYHPTIWQITLNRDSTISAIVASGRYKQLVEGLPKGIPMITLENKYLDVGKMEGVKEFTSLSRLYFKRPPDTVIDARHDPLNAKSGQVIIGAIPKVTTDREPLKPFFGLPGLYFPENPKLEKAIRDGTLRRATADDYYIWLQVWAHRENIPYHLLPEQPLSDDYSYMHNRGYVVLSRDFVVPSGLAGAHAVTFFIPSGIPMPTGDKGHCDFVFLESGKEYDPGLR